MTGRPRHPGSTRPPRRVCRLCWRERVRAHPHGYCVPSCTLPTPRTRQCAECGALRLAKYLERDACGRWRCTPAARGTCCDTVVPPGAPEKRCCRCRDWWPLTPAFWHRWGSRTKWSPMCRACRAERRAELAAGAPRNRRGVKLARCAA